MTHKELHELKLSFLTPLYAMVEEMDGEEIKILDFWDTWDYTHTWKTKSYFTKDFIKFSPENIINRSVRKAGTFSKIEKKMLTSEEIFDKMLLN